MSIYFFINAIAFGIGLAMDAFSVSLANGLNEPQMPKRRMTFIAATFGIFQTIMPLIGWFCIHTIFVLFEEFQKFIPWIALILLGYIGGKMLYEAIIDKGDEEIDRALDNKELIIQGIATSIDALSVGFTIAYYPFMNALNESVIIGITTFVISYFGIILGKIFGTRFKKLASYLGGIILILIGLQIFIQSFI